MHLLCKHPVEGSVVNVRRARLCEQHGILRASHLLYRTCAKKDKGPSLEPAIPLQSPTYTDFFESISSEHQSVLKKMQRKYITKMKKKNTEVSPFSVISM